MNRSEGAEEINRDCIYALISSSPRAADMNERRAQHELIMTSRIINLYHPSMQKDDFLSFIASALLHLRLQKENIYIASAPSSIGAQIKQH
jgi:hypothetical protein